jgi:hypothetical protein
VEPEKPERLVSLARPTVPWNRYEAIIPKMGDGRGSADLSGAMLNPTAMNAK